MKPPNIPDYILDALIGEGSTGAVWSATYQGRSKLAVKALRGLAINRQVLSDSLVKIYNGTPHPGIATIYDFDLASPNAYITTELYAEKATRADGSQLLRPRNLEALCGAVSPEDGWRIALQIADAMAFLHRTRIIHCNLKPSNVLFEGGTDPRPKIVDFTQGMLGGIEQLETSDSLFYCAPEQLRDGDHFFEGRGEKWDVYAYGATVYRLLTGNFSRLNEEITDYRKKRANQLDLHISVSPEQIAGTLSRQETITWPSAAMSEAEKERRRIIENCLKLDESQRYVDMREVLSALQSSELETRHSTELKEFEDAKRDFEKTSKKFKWPYLATAAAAASVAALATTAYQHVPRPQLPGIPPADTSTSSTGIAVDEQEPAIQPVQPIQVAANDNTPDIEESRLAKLVSDFQQSQAALNELCQMIVARDSEGNALYNVPEGTIGTILTYYEQFVNRNETDPVMRNALATALSNASELNLILGDFTAASQKLTRAAALLENDEIGGGGSGEILQRRALLYQNLATARNGSRMHNAATEAAKKSYLIFKELLKRDAGNQLAARNAAQSALSLAKNLYRINQQKEANHFANEAIQIISKSKDADLPLEQDQALQASANFELGQIARKLGETDRARKEHQKSIAGYTELVTSIPEKLDYQFQLARALGEEADIAFITADPGATMINKDSIEILNSLTQQSPLARYKYELARRLHSLSRSMRDEGESSAARTQGGNALIILKELVKSEPSNFDYQKELAHISRDLAELHLEAGDKDKTIALSREAVTLMENLLNKDRDIENNNSQRTYYRERSARFYGLLGWHLGRIGNKSDTAEARKSFKTAQDYYQQILDLDPVNDGAKRGLEWAKESLIQLP